MKNKTGQRGFTLVEMMIVVAILGIIAGIGTTLLLNYLPNMRLKSATRDIFSIMMQAKVEAIQRAENVTVLFNSPGTTYTMFLDNGAGGSNNQVIDLGETILATATLPDKATYGPVDLNNDGDFVDPGEVAVADGVSFANNALIFTPRGMPVTPTGGLGGGTVGLRAIDSSGNILRQRSVTVSSAGRISMN